MASRRARFLVPLLALAALLPGLPAGAAAPDWPREVRSGNATLVLYQPQFDALDGVATRARIAVAIQRPDRAPEFGALWVAATLDVDRDADTASFKTFDVERARFPDATAQEVRDLTALIEKTAPTWDLNLSLAELRAGLEAEGATGDPGFRNDPPAILYRDRPALLVTIDGDPRLQGIEGTRYQRVANTPFPIVYDPAAREYWLFGSEVWFTTKDLNRGRWTARDEAPAGIAALFAKSGEDADQPLDAGEGVPKEQLRRAEIVVSTKPAELISTDGAPLYRPLVGDDMLYVTNTGSDLFLEVPTKRYYVVLSGRWYRSSALAGPWTYVPADRVPQAFADVPRQSDKAGVLAHVPGTDEAKDAVMDAMIPQTTTVRRGRGEVEVEYDGSPRFGRIPGTALYYAENTASQVLKVADRYYVVEQGVWYESDSPFGPWEVADERPDGVEKIPASSPAYNVKYVYIYDTTPDVVYVGYLPGYTWAFPYHGALVYGTGWYYRPWYGPAVYYPRPATWGFHVHYTPWYGWGYGMSWTAGWASFSFAWGDGWGYPGWRPYYPAWRGGYRAGYRRGYWDGLHTGGWFGPGGYRPPVRHHDRDRDHDRRDARWDGGRDHRGGDDHRRGIDPPERSQIGSLPGIGGRPSARYRPSNNLYARPASRPGADREARTDRNSRGDQGRTGRTDRPAATGGRKDTQPVPRANPRLPNNVYVDRNGVPYRTTRDGWQTRANREWRPAPEVDRATRPGNEPRADDRGSNPGRGGEGSNRPPSGTWRPSSPVDNRPPTGNRNESPRTDSRQAPPRQESRQPPGGWGNRSGPRDGPSLPSAEHSRMRSGGDRGGDRGGRSGDRGGGREDRR